MENTSLSAITDSLSNIHYDLILHVLILLAVGTIILRILRLILKKTVLRKSNQQNEMLVLKLFNFIGFSILLIVVLSEMGIQLTTLLGAAGVMGIALGVASQKSLGNIISGFFMVTEKSFEIGDVITVGTKTGVVHSVELLSIMLKTFDNLLIRIPHETLISTEVVNITRFHIRRMDLFFTVSYREDLNQVMEILKETGRNNLLCLDEPNPFILIKEFGESGIDFQFGIWFEKNDYVAARNSVLTDLLKNFRAAGITIPYPHITISPDSRLSMVDVTEK